RRASARLPDGARARTREPARAPRRTPVDGLPGFNRIPGEPYANLRELARMQFAKIGVISVKAFFAFSGQQGSTRSVMIPIFRWSSCVLGTAAFDIDPFFRGNTFAGANGNFSTREKAYETNLARQI